MKTTDKINEKIELYEYLCDFITDQRKQRFEDVIKNRTRHITVVLEDIYQSQNTSAVLRTCDCFGIQDINIIENKNKYYINPDVALGSYNWLTIHNYNKKKENTLECLQYLKNQGFKIIATSPHKNDCSIENLDITQKTAIVFGTEKEGVSELLEKQFFCKQNGKTNI